MDNKNMEQKIIDKIMFDNFLKSVPTMVVDAKDRKTISAYGSIDVNDLRSAIDTFKKVPDYGELLKQVEKQKEVINKVNKYLNEYDVFKVFSFPLMKRWEEEQIKSSIDYEFKTSLVKDLKDILKEEK